MDDDVTALPARMLGLEGFEVLAAGEVGGELELLVQTLDTLAGCPVCGVVATAHGRRDHLVRDIPSAGRPVLLVWRKRLWDAEDEYSTAGLSPVGSDPGEQRHHAQPHEEHGANLVSGHRRSSPIAVSRECARGGE